MEWRHKAYHRTGNNEQRIKEIRESIKNIRNRSKRKTSVKRDRFRLLSDAQEHLKNSTTAINGLYSERCEYLTKLNEIICETQIKELNNHDFFEELCLIMLQFLKDDHPCIRAMCFHILRKTTISSRNLIFILTSHVDIYMVRAVDLQMENDDERIEAFKLINWLMKVYENSELKKFIIDESKIQSSQKKYAFPKSIMQPIISIALSEFHQEKFSTDKLTRNYEDEPKQDIMAKPCVALFLEFCLSEPDLIIEMAGTDWMVRVLTGVSKMSRRIVLLVSHVLMAWLDNPLIRAKANLHMVLDQIFAPLIEYGFFQKKPTPNNELNDPFSMSDVLDHFKVTFLCLLKSWPGLFACAAVGPNATVSASSPLRLLEYLGLGTVENDNLLRIRDTIVDICCEFVDLPYASKRFSSWSEAVDFYKSMHLPNKFRSDLKHDFVIAENDTRITHDVNLQRPSIDLLSAFRTLCQYILINASLPQSLARLILAKPDSPSGLKATLLLADLLRYAPSHVPTGWRAPVLCLPTLVQSACESLIQAKSTAAINGTLDELKSQDLRTFMYSENAELILHRVDKLNRSWIRSASNSATIQKESYLQLFVPHIVSVANYSDYSNPEQLLSARNATSPSLTEDYYPGNIMETVLKGPYDKNKLILINDLDDYDYTRNHSGSITFDDDEDKNSLFQTENGQLNWNYFEYYSENLENDTDENILKELSSKSVVDNIADLFNYMNPNEQKTNNRPISTQQVIVIKLILQLIWRAMKLNDMKMSDYLQILTKYLVGFKNSFSERENPYSFFYPRNLTHTGSMFHFAIVGKFTTSKVGTALLNDVGILHQFSSVMVNSTTIDYIKLITSSLDYSTDGMTRVILKAALTSTNEESRKWTTRFLSVLSDTPNFADWGIQLMLRQLGDESPKVVRQAIRVLSRCLPCYTKSSNVHNRIQWSSFGEAGDLLRIHAFANEKQCVENKDDVLETIRYWMNSFNKKYVETIEDDFREVLYSIRRTMTGTFARSSSSNNKKSDYMYGIPAPTHLFAVLASHATGRSLLLDENVADTLCAQIDYHMSSPFSGEYNEVKAALIALASIGSTSDGFLMLPAETLARIIKVAEEDNVLSLRGIGFWACCIISQSVEGAKRLAQFGWESNKYRFATDLAKIKSDFLSISLRDEAATNSCSTPVSITQKRMSQQHYRNSSIVEIQNKNRAKSESIIVGRRRTARTRSSSDSKSININESTDSFSMIRKGWNSDMTLNEKAKEACSVDGRRLTIGSMTSPQPGECGTAPSAIGATMRRRSSTANEDDGNHSNRPMSTSFATSKMSHERKRGNTITSIVEDDSTLRTRSSTVARCIREGMTIPRSQLINEGTIADTIMDWHFSCKIREKYQLAPFRIRTYLLINRNIGDPVRYIFMTKEEEMNFAEYRMKILGDSWLYNELQKEFNAVKKTVNVIPLQIVALPAEVEIMCGNVFPLRPKAENLFGIEYDESEALCEDRGAKSGHSKNEFIIQQPHSTYRCFYCSGKKEYTRSYPHPEAAALRRQVLHHVDMLEIKDDPAKRLIGLRQRHQWLFEWPCMYADVLELLDEYRFKPHSRSFLQQIFYEALKL